MATFTGYSINEVAEYSFYGVGGEQSPQVPYFGPSFEAENMQGKFFEFDTFNDGVGSLLVGRSTAEPAKRAISSDTSYPRKRLIGANSPDGPTGDLVGKYSDDFYHRIHLTPSTLPLGNLVSTQTRGVEVWNAYLTAVDLEDVVVTNGDGIVITPPVVTPYTMSALESLVYEVQISTDGPPTIDASIRWVVDDSVSIANYDAPITGNRVIPFPLQPDWKDGLEEVLEWKTDIIKSYSQKEQRAQIRLSPRRNQTYNYTLFRGKGAYMENLLWGWQSRFYAVPHWQDASVSQTSLFQGQSLVNVDTTQTAYTVGSLLYVAQGDSYEMQEIVTVNAGSVELAKGLDNAWTSPVVLAPANLARIDGDMDVSMSRVTADIATATVQWAHEPITTDPWLPSAAAPLTYLGSEILLKEPNWVDNLGAEFSIDANPMDFETGGFAIASRSGIPEIVRPYEWFLKGRDQMVEFREFLERRSGRLNGFWMPSWTHDFNILAAVAAASSGFDAQENFYGILVDGADGRNHICIILNDGRVVLKEISSAQNNFDGTVTVNLTETVGEDFTPSQVKACMTLGWYRLNSDRVEIKYETQEFATCRMGVVNILPES